MLDPFYLIVDDVQWMKRLIPQGVRLVQLRIKDKSLQEIKKQVLESLALCKTYKTQLVLNDYWQLAIKLGCNFVHLGQEDLQHANIPALREANVQIGISTHDDTELTTALSIKPAYIALGPVYPTILKKMPWAPQGLEKVRQWKTKVGDVPLVGIGGLSVERAPKVLAAGADIVSVVTDVSLHTNPEQRVKEWLRVTRS